ncbi:hypothetical protein [Solibacillus sp. FSL K6-1523]|uniref:hypothetical protein n=1 Tax=Solibacillus sp. FSL K6-1523 TaxID=2921471 RepID=UPI0030FBD65A
MTVSEQSLRNAISTIASIKEISMNPQHLLLDIFALSKVPAFAEDEKFNSVLHTITKALLEIVQNPTIGESLKNDFAGFKSLHKKSDYPTDPPHDDLRIVYHPETGQVWLVAFGHRYLPDDFYTRIRASKRV